LSLMSSFHANGDDVLQRQLDDVMERRTTFSSQRGEVTGPTGQLGLHWLSSPSEPAGGPPVVFVPGLGASSRTMIPTAQLMPTGRTVFIVDLPSHGDSDRRGHELTLSGFADVVFAWLVALDLREAILVGHSFGSQVLVQLASDHPPVKGLALISPTVDPHFRTLGKQLLRLFLDAVHEPPALLLLLLHDYLRTGFSGLRDLGADAIHDRVETKLPRIEAPTLLIRGARDPLVPERWANEMASLLPNGALVVIPGGTHALQYQSPAEVARALTSFFAATGRH
jgi:2-hydroxy-6-oxonona-2,4-dienedioate hydrolase